MYASDTVRGTASEYMNVPLVTGKSQSAAALAPTGAATEYMNVPVTGVVLQVVNNPADSTSTDDSNLNPNPNPNLTNPADATSTDEFEVLEHTATADAAPVEYDVLLHPATKADSKAASATAEA
jgi:hypothetical protein